jgi:hypothetical protein
MNEADTKFLHDLAISLEKAQRFGADTDEPEGGRYIQLSDTLAGKISRRLCEIAERCQVKNDKQ